jgi:uncharacterized protein YcbK (DUF882 family)
MTELDESGGVNDNAVSRRRFLKTCAGALAASVIGREAAAMTGSPYFYYPGYFQRPGGRLSFYNTHTGEFLSTEYRDMRGYMPQALAEINQVLRDHRNDEIYPINPGLLDLLDSLNRVLDSRQALHIVSAYRSPATNAMLAAHSDGVARHSLHMQGMAIDIRVPGRELWQVHDAAMTLQRGGVGYYRRSDFVHVDVGRVRYW